MKAIFVAVQDESSRRWFPAARVVKESGKFRLNYTRGARELKGFTGFGRMHDFTKVYVSDELFPLLKNRVLPKGRPEYREYLEWLGLSAEEHDELDELSRSGGLRATDSIELIPCPEANEDGNYQTYFFARGIRHLPEGSSGRVLELKKGDKLFAMKDFQNERDADALLLRTDDPISIVGYVPRFYNQDFSALSETSAVETLSVVVERVNIDAPSPYRLLCRISAPWPSAFHACESDTYKSIAFPIGPFSVE